MDKRHDNSDYTDSGDCQPEPRHEPMREAHRYCIIRVSPDCPYAPPMWALKQWAIDYCAGQIEAGLIARQFDWRRN